MASTIAAPHPGARAPLATLERVGLELRLRRAQLGFLAVVVVLYVHIHAFSHALIDDAYIQFGYARTLTESQTWGLIDGHTANTATSPLNVILTALCSLLPGPLIENVIWLTVAEFAVCLLFLLAISRSTFGNAGYACIAFASIALNPLLLSTIGLEGTLYVTLFIGCLWGALKRRPIVLAVLLALLTLTRADGLLLVIVILAAADLRPSQRLAVLGVFLTCMAPWHIYSWIHLGSFGPDTLLIKLNQRWDGATFADGPALYFSRNPVATSATLIMAPFALYAIYRRGPAARELVVIPLLYGILHFAAYSALRVPPYHWYFLHSVIPLALAGAYGAWRLVQDNAPVPLADGRRLWLRTCFATSPVVVAFAVVCVAAGWPWTSAPIHTNMATSGRYQEIANSLNDTVPAPSTVIISGEIGTLAYDARLDLLNEFSDPNVATVISERGGSPVRRRIVSIDHAWRSDQPFVECPEFMLEEVAGVDSKPFLGPALHGVLVTTWDISSTWLPASRLYLWRVGRAETKAYYVLCN